MKIDVILPTYNRADLLTRALDSALDATTPAGHTIQIIVVDNNSTDRTKALVADYMSKCGPRLQYLFEPKQGRHHALNCGIAQSSADVIAFFDDDERLVPSWFETIAENFARPDIDFIGGRVLPEWSAPPPAWLPKRGYGGVLGIIDHGNRRRRYRTPDFPEMLTGGNTAMRRSALTACGTICTRKTGICGNASAPSEPAAIMCLNSLSIITFPPSACRNHTFGNGLEMMGTIGAKWRV